MGSILITGTPATGKSELAKRLSSDLNIPEFDIKDEVKKRDLVDYVDNDGTLVIDEKSVKDLYRQLSDENELFILHGHLAHYATHENNDNVILIVTRCDITELNERLKERGYSEEKIRDNIDSEIFEVCKVESQERGFETIEFHTDNNNNSDYDALLRRIRLTLKGSQSDS
jgi:adenylate kinase